MTPETTHAMARLIEAAERYLEEPVVAAGIFSRPGSMATIAVSSLSPISALLRSRIGKRQAAGLPVNVLIAVTASGVHGLEFRPFYSSVKVKREVARWARRDVRVAEVVPGRLASRVVLAIGDQRVALDANAGDRHGVSAAVIDLLRDEVPV